MKIRDGTLCELKVYPNPIRKGKTFQITWPSTPGVNQVRCYGASGALVQVLEVEVSSLMQTYTWEVPAPFGRRRIHYPGYQAGAG